MRQKFSFTFTILVLLLSCRGKESTPVAQSSPKENITVKSGYASVNGIKLYYEISGTGSPLVMIHGGGSTIETTFGNFRPRLAEHFMTVAVELQAHGHSSDRSGPSTFEQDADDVAALLKTLNIEKASFFGFSNGGNTAMQIAVRHPEIVNKLIIASAFYKREGMIPGFFGGLEKATINDMPSELRTAFLKIENNDSTKLMAMFLDDRNRMIQFTDWKDEVLASIKAPALIIAGDKDVMTSVHTAEMANQIIGAELLIVPGTHGSFMMEGAIVEKMTKTQQYTLDAINDFLTR